MISEVYPDRNWLDALGLPLFLRFISHRTQVIMDTEAREIQGRDIFWDGPGSASYSQQGNPGLYMANTLPCQE